MTSVKLTVSLVSDLMGTEERKERIIAVRPVLAIPMKERFPYISSALAPHAKGNV